MDDLFGVGDDSKIRIVRHEDDLPPLLGLLDDVDQDFIDAPVALWSPGRASWGASLSRFYACMSKNAIRIKS